jgi:hypothetical protein
LMLCLDSVATILSATCTGLQGLTTLLHQQVSQFEQLKATLSNICRINGPHSSEECAGLNAEAIVIRDAFSVKLADAIAFIKNQGTFVINSLAELGDEEATDISRMVGNLFLGLFCGIAAIVATRTSQNETSSAELPPVLPHSLSKVRTAHVCKLVREQRFRLERSGWSDVEIENIDVDHRNLLHSYRSEPTFRDALDKCSDASTFFEDGWRLANGRFTVLRQFAGGLASIFSNTATVESDFSLIGWEKNAYRQYLTDFSLEGILHAKQFNQILSFIKPLAETTSNKGFPTIYHD